MEVGTLVFLTHRGIALYDGKNWVVEKPTPIEPLRSSHLVTGRGDHLWIHVGRECWRRSDETWVQVTDTPVPSHESSRFLRTQKDGADRLVIVERAGRVHVFDGSDWKTIAPSPALSLGSFTTADMVNGRCLVGSEGGVLEFDLLKGTSKVWDLDLPAGGIHGMDYDAIADALWLVGSSWIVRVDNVRRGEHEVALSYSGVPFVRGRDETRLDGATLDTRWSATGEAACAADLSGGLYVGDAFAVFYFNPETGVEQMGVRNGLMGGGITSAMRDREGNMWLCGLRGANKVVSRQFMSYDRDQGLFDDEVTAALQLSDGSMVLGHGSGLTFMGPAEPETITLSPDVLADRVMDLTEDASGRLWLAAGRLGLGHLEPDGSVQFVQQEPPTSVVGVESSDDGGGVWVATDLGLYRYQVESWRKVPLVRGVDRIQLRKITSDPAGGLLIATGSHGVLSHSDGVSLQWTSPHYQISSTYTVLRDSQGTVWAGTRAGLAQVDDHGQLVLALQPPVDRPIYALTEDQQGRLWIGTDLGVLCWDGRTCRAFSAAEGLLGQETNRSALIVADDGRVWIGTDRGISVYDERFDVPRMHGPTVELGSVEAGGQSYDLSIPATISHDSRTLSFGFKVFSFVDEDHVRIQTRLDGWDSGWSTPSHEPSRRIRYTNLPSGDYRLNIRAIDVEDRMSPEVVSAPLRIQDPLWLRGWFLAGAGTLLLLLTSGSVGLLVQRRFTRRLQREVRARTVRLREMEREQEKLLRLESLGLLAGGIAHDFNNLLTTIVGSVSLLENETGISPEGQARLGDMDAASWKAHSLAAQLLTFSRGGAPIKEAGAIGEVIKECAGFTLRGSSVRAEYDIPDDLCVVEIDTGQISQVVNNIMINARQSMSEGGTIHIRARNVMRSGASQEVVVEFTDEGPGIPADMIGRVFDPYFSTKKEGRGLGLATAYVIIQRHGGELSVSSVPGQGATFQITLPGSEAAILKPLPKPARHAMPCTKVLVMDDLKSVRTVTRRALERAGCVVIEATEGVEAIRLYEEAHRAGSPVDVVIMDLTVPGGMGGLQATSSILAFDPDARIIVTSGYTENDALAEHGRYGFAARLVKPYRLDDLLSVVAKVLRAKEGRLSGNP